MNNNKIIEDLLEQKNRLSKIIQVTEKRLQKAPGGQVRIVKHQNGFQFYLREKPTDTSGKYLPVKDRKMAVDLIQKRYDNQIIRAAEKQEAVIERFVAGYEPDVLKNIYEKLSEIRRKNIIPAELPDHEYIEEWKSIEYLHKDFAEGTPEHFTSNGERVRSKSEVMIADALKQEGIPYKYECPLDLGDRIIYPDFTILRMSDREQVYWEHLGMMDDPDYCNKAILKIRGYEYNGILPGINLILTMETSGIPINHTVISRMIKTYCV